MSYRIKAIQATKDFESLESCWKQLETDSNNKNLTASFDWQITWWKAFKDRKDKQFGHKKELRILLLYKDDQLIGIAPFVKVTRQTKYLIRKTSIEFLGQQWGGCFLDYIGHLNSNEQKLFKNWLYKNDQFDYILLQYIPEWTNNFNLNLENSYLFSGCPAVLSEDLNDFHQYETSKLSKNLKQNLRTAHNRIKRSNYDYSCITFEKQKTDEVVINEIKKISLSKLKDKRNKHSIFSDPVKSAFYTKVLDKFNSQILFIKLNDSFVAYRTNLIYNNIKNCIDASYDRDFPKFDLGTLSVFENIKHSFKHKITLHSEGVGLDSYKRRFCGSIISLYSVFYDGNTYLSFLFKRKTKNNLASLEQNYLQSVQKAK